MSAELDELRHHWGDAYEIFVNNVRRVKADAMVKPELAKSSPLEAFLGRKGVVDTATREEEDAFEYVCRHTLLRPRDLMTIGERLVALRPDDRRNEYRLQESVNLAAVEIAHEYLAEIAPYVAGLDPDRLFRLLPGHVMTRAQLDAVAEQCGANACGHDPFGALWRCGLLGYVQHDRVRGEWRQRFLRPGEATLETESALPASTRYLLHPVLFDVVARLNPAFAQRIDRVNIVGKMPNFLPQELHSAGPTSGFDVWPCILIFIVSTADEVEVVFCL